MQAPTDKRVLPPESSFSDAKVWAITSGVLILRIWVHPSFIFSVLKANVERDVIASRMVMMVSEKKVSSKPRFSALITHSDMAFAVSSGL